MAADPVKDPVENPVEARGEDLGEEGMVTWFAGPGRLVEVLVRVRMRVRALVLVRVRAPALVRVRAPALVLVPVRRGFGAPSTLRAPVGPARARVPAGSLPGTPACRPADAVSPVTRSDAGSCHM
ncbi:hypothetical protein [Streptomyces paludis]|uniref:hypothetical protein n=1 Tax=Streptomyces paludis TaxID=2282738 RepID=UPI0013B3C485|nr:hypothetical protein [Streptomyces paludis]